MWQYLEDLVLQNLDNLHTCEIDIELQVNAETKKIPAKIIKPSIFREDLLKLENVLIKQNRELVIKPRNVTRYIRRSIAKCIQIESSIVITIKVYVNRAGLN